MNTTTWSTEPSNQSSVLENSNYLMENSKQKERIPSKSWNKKLIWGMIIGVDLMIFCDLFFNEGKVLIWLFLNVSGTY